MITTILGICLIALGSIGTSWFIQVAIGTTQATNVLQLLVAWVLIILGAVGIYIIFQ